MGSPVAPLVCNLYMEDLEQRAIRSALHPPEWWKRYVDDVHAKILKTYEDEFLEHLNSIDSDIKWTAEKEAKLPTNQNAAELESTEVRSERALAFLDSWSIVNDNGTVKTRVYRKETHTDQYLNFKSNHPLEHKRGVVKTLYHRANKLVTQISC